MELVRDSVVAAIDELRMMVSGFYIESREAALRASEEKYRNSIDHAPDPMYEIDPNTFGLSRPIPPRPTAMHRIVPEHGGQAAGRPQFDRA